MQSYYLKDFHVIVEYFFMLMYLIVLHCLLHAYGVLFVFM